MHMAVIAVPHFEVAEDEDIGLRPDAFDETSKLGKEGGERFGVEAGRWAVDR